MIFYISNIFRYIMMDLYYVKFYDDQTRLVYNNIASI